MREPADGREEIALVAALRRGDESAFAAVVDAHQAGLLRVARGFVRDESAAEEVVQETWQALVRGIDRFEGRSSLKTWLFHVVANRARTRAVREARTAPFSAVFDDAGGDEPAVDAARFRPPGEPLAGHWASPVRGWDEEPEERLLAAETRAVVAAAIAALPSGQRAVITLRDIEGCDAVEVCNALGISETNQRVLLHRARSRVRRALEAYLERA